jgi:hypothetical protein
MTPSRSGALTIALLAQRSIRVLGDRDFFEKQKGMRIKGGTKALSPRARPRADRRDKSFARLTAPPQVSPATRPRLNKKWDD